MKGASSSLVGHKIWLGICNALTLVFVSVQNLWCCQKGGREVEPLTLAANIHLGISRWSLLEQTE